MAEIKGSFIFKCLEGTDAFFKEYTIEKDELCQQDFLLQVKKQNDVWKISYYHIQKVIPLKQ